MSRITGEFVAAVARVWHRLEPGGGNEGQAMDQDMETLAQMLAPMDDAGEDLSASVAFDMEPSDFLAGLEAMAGDGKDS